MVCFYMYFHWRGSGTPPSFCAWSKSRNWISNVIYSGLFLCSVSSVVFVRFVESGGIDDHHCLNFLFMILLKRKPTFCCFVLSVKKVMVNNSTNINKTNNHLSSQFIEYKQYHHIWRCQSKHCHWAATNIWRG
jgi:hypothetical protein